MRVDFRIWMVLVGLSFGCGKTEDLIDFTEEDEILLGEKLSAAIAEDSAFNIISEENNSIAYGYANSRLSEITSGATSKSDDFSWSVTLLDDETRQAFALPGGCLYVSTGMIFYLSNEDEFSGLLAHLVAHVDQSHVTELLFFEYGVNGLKSIATSDNPDQLLSIVHDLDLRDEFLVFSRGNELAADTLAISLLSNTEQSCQAGGLFMNRTLNVQSDFISAFISAHRFDTTRVSDIIESVAQYGCETSVDDESDDRFSSFRNSLQ